MSNTRIELHIGKFDHRGNEYIPGTYDADELPDSFQNLPSNEATVTNLDQEEESEPQVETNEVYSSSNEQGATVTSTEVKPKQRSTKSPKKEDKTPQENKPTKTKSANQ